MDKAAALHPEIPARQWSMGKLGWAAFGPVGDRFIRTLFALELWFALETFLVLTGISVNLLTGISQPPVIVVAGMLGCLSLGLPMNAVSYASLLAVSCMVGGLFALVFCGFGRIWDSENTPDALTQHIVVDVPGIPGALGIFLYCFSGLPCLPNIRNAMRRPAEEYAVAIHYAFLYSSLYYMAVGMLGYQFFASDTRQSFLKDLIPIPEERHKSMYAWVAMMASGLFALKLQAGFPLYAAPILGAIGVGGGDGVPHWPAKHTWIARGLFALVSIFFAIMARNQLDAVAELMGAFLTNSTSIMFPVASYCALTDKLKEKMSTRQTSLLYGLMLFGASYGVIGTVSASYRLFEGSLHPGALSGDAMQNATARHMRNMSYPSLIRVDAT